VDLGSLLATVDGFEWDEANGRKNWERHAVTTSECEEAFFNQPIVAGRDDAHSADELRLFLLGKTDSGRRLFVAFTLRGKNVRVISARDMSRREREVHDAKAQENSEIQD
jgi:uncharacterized DUF497 family protein